MYCEISEYYFDLLTPCCNHHWMMVVSVGASTSNCLGNLATLNGDLVAYINPDPRPGSAPGWRSLTSTPVPSTDAIVNPTTFSATELYQLAACGMPYETPQRSTSCNNLKGLSSGQTYEHQALQDTVAGMHDIATKLGSTAIYNKVSDTMLSLFGTFVGNSPTTASYLRQAVVLRSNPGDYGYQQDFLSYSLTSFDAPSPAIYNTFTFMSGVPGTPSVVGIGREFWLTNQGSDGGLPPNYDRPSGLVLSYACPQTTSNPQCATVTLLSQGATLTYFGTTTTQPTNAQQQVAISPPGLTLPANSIVRFPNLVIDAQGQFHIFFVVSSPSPAPGTVTVSGYYLYCLASHDPSNLSKFTMSASNCVTTTLFVVSQNSASDYRMVARHFNGTQSLGPTIVVAAYTVDDRRDSANAATPNFAVRLFTLKPSSRPLQPWTQTSTIFPPNPTPINGATATNHFTFPNNGRLYDFDLAITDTDSTATKVAISYSYTRYTNAYGNKKRATPGNPDASKEEFVFRTILCPEFRCLTFTTRQLMGSRVLFQNQYGTVPRGFKGVISGKFNNGYPAFAFSVGSGDKDSTFRSGPQPLLPGSAFTGGAIGLLECLDNTCLGASLERANEYLAGFRGEFLFAPTPSGVLLGSLPVTTPTGAPVFQAFNNPAASPNTQRCSASIAGIQRSIDGEVFVCTAIPDIPILDATAVFYWAPVIPPMQAMVSVSPINIGNAPFNPLSSLPTC